MSTKTWRVDERLRPVYKLAVEGGIDADEQLRALVADALAPSSLGQPYGTVVVLAPAVRISAKHRKLAADALHVHEVQLRRYCRAVAIVVDSPIVRGALTAIFWLASPPFPLLMAATEEEATRWVRAHLDERSQPAAL